MAAQQGLGVLVITACAWQAISSALSGDRLTSVPAGGEHGCERESCNSDDTSLLMTRPSADSKRPGWWLRRRRCSHEDGGDNEEAVNGGQGTFQACIDDACNDIPTGSKTYDSGNEIGNDCDTLYWTGAWPLKPVKVNWWSTLGSVHKLALFSTDYCTGTPFVVLDAASQEDGGWHSISGEYIKSARPYNNDLMKPGQAGVGIKINFFPLTGMMPYDQFTCKSDLSPSCSQYNNNCDTGLVKDSSPTGQGPGGECASGDDRIFCIEPDDNGKVIYTNGIPGQGGMDFAGSCCNCDDFNNDYTCTFQDYPIGSVWVGLYYLNWNNGYCGANFAAGNMGTSADGFCDNSADQKIVEARSKCLWMRFWKSSKTVGPGTPTPGWDDYPFAQIVKPLGDFCFADRAGFNFNICNPPAGQDKIGGLTDFYWCADATSGCSQYDLDCGASWPMFTEFFYVKILDCP